VRMTREPEHVAFGEQAVRIGSLFCQLNTIEIHGTRTLGRTSRSRCMAIAPEQHE
jgi:hypothetical protein